jgi:hypothetical protein
LNIDLISGLIKNTSPKASERVTKPLRVFLRTIYSLSDRRRKRWENPLTKHL